MLDELLTLPKVHAWTASKPADDVIGYVGMCELCPLASYLNEVHTGHDHAVSTSIIQIDDAQGQQWAPDWVDAVVASVDSGCFEEPITAAQFLAILDSVASEVQP